MPDPTFETISATQASQLLNKSPYGTCWTLYREFLDRRLHEATENDRMRFGKLLEPALTDEAAKRLRIEVKPDQIYRRRGLFGCTADNIAIDPQRGPGALETKICWDYGVWMQAWAGGERPPEHMLIQLQVQMYVGDGTTPYSWGCLAPLVCGTMEFFPIEPWPRLWADLERRAEDFFRRVREQDEPDPLGDEVELPIINELWPLTEKKEQTLEDEALAEAARMYNWLKEQENGNKRAAEGLKAKLLHAAGDFDTTYLPGGNIIRVTKTEVKATDKRKGYTQVRLNIHAPDDAVASWTAGDANTILAG